MNSDKAFPEPMTKWLVALALAFITVAVYLPVLENGFTGYDDPDYVTQNSMVQQGLSWKGVEWAFSSFSASNWHPLTWLSLMLDCELYGLDPSGHHLTSLCLHVANTVLLFLWLYRLTARLWSGAVVALLFAIHPLHVDSVAWAAERKDVLSGFFCLLTLLAYTRYAAGIRGQKSEVGGQNAPMPPSSIFHLPSSIFYPLALFCFALGLLAKPMLVTLPGVLLLLDYWPLRRITGSAERDDRTAKGVGRRAASFHLPASCLLDKLPFLALAAGSCVVTLLAQSKLALHAMTVLPWSMRLTQVPMACAWYVVKLFWPAHLSIFYPMHLPEPLGLLGAVSLIVVIIWLACRFASRQPWLLVGWFWFLLMLVPVCGIVQVGDAAYANRYTYLPYIGLFIILAWGCPLLVRKWRKGWVMLAASTLLAGAMLAHLASQQVRVWRDNPSLFGHALAMDEDNPVAWTILGLEAQRVNDLDRAVYCLRRATMSDGWDTTAWNDLGCALCAQQKFGGARDAYQMALHCQAVQPASLGLLYYNLGQLELAAGQLAAGVTNLQKAVQLVPDQAEYHRSLGGALVQTHQPDQARQQFQNALRLESVPPAAELALAQKLAANQRFSQAIDHLHELLVLEPELVPALNNLAWLLATAPDAAQRDGAEAVRLAEQACQLTGRKEAVLLGTLAAAYAEAGRYQEAVAAANEARALALAQGQTDVAAANEQLRKIYESGRPFHQ